MEDYILDRNLDPNKKMSLNYTLRWLTQAWRNDLLDQTDHSYRTGLPRALLLVAALIERICQGQNVLN
jgi:hypothetical protein